MNSDDSFVSFNGTLIGFAQNFQLSKNKKICFEFEQLTMVLMVHYKQQYLVKIVQSAELGLNNFVQLSSWEQSNQGGNRTPTRLCSTLATILLEQLKIQQKLIPFSVWFKAGIRYRAFNFILSGNPGRVAIPSLIPPTLGQKTGIA